MKILNSKRNRQILTLPAIAITLMLTSCASTKARDERLIENLEKQNAVLDAAQADREVPEVKAQIESNDTLKEAEKRLTDAMAAVKKANQTVISKIKPKDKTECPNNETEGDDNE